ncbi:MAG: AAA family ATPase, partial [Planctomycetota bacterium]
GGGGGIVPGSATMLGGDPGIGKSTLMLQAAIALARQGKTVLYVTSEESAGQLRLRAQRLAPATRLPAAHGADPPPPPSLPAELFVLADTNLARIAEQARKLQPALLVIDSIQMVYKGDLPAAPGSVTQLRACCLELVYHAKSTNSALMLVGHVTKQGALAGPRLLEHMVDTVLYFEGDRYHSHRVVRAVKNRFGSTLEVGLFEMTDRGLLEVHDGAGLLAAEYQPRSGSVVCPVLSGTRCLLIEMQALTATGFLGSAKRKVSGLDKSRLDMLIAVLEKRGGLRLADQDIFASSVGGIASASPPPTCPSPSPSPAPTSTAGSNPPPAPSARSAWAARSAASNKPSDASSKPPASASNASSAPTPAGPGSRAPRSSRSKPSTTRCSS